MTKTQVQIEKFATSGGVLKAYEITGKYINQGYTVTPFEFAKVTTIFIDHNLKTIYAK